MDSLASSSSVPAAAASASEAGTVQGAASISVLRKALHLQASSAVQLLESLPQPALATSGSLGTQVNTFA
jgi:hypothetical protein